MAVHLGDFEDLSQRCREFGGGGLAGFLADERISALCWPEDVVEQWLYWFAGWGSFQADYGHLDLTSIEWHDELVPSVAFLTMPTGPSDGDLLDENAEKAEDRLKSREHLGIPAYWDSHGTWMRRPLIIDRAALHPAGSGIQVIEGRTRVGVLRGLIQRGRSVAPEHAAWVARTR
jgi:hypothetical protein